MQATMGGSRSSIVTVNEQLPAVGAVQVTVVVPLANTEPEGGRQVTVPQEADVPGAG